MEIEFILNQINTLPAISLEKLTRKLSKVNLRKGTLLFNAGKIESHIYFIEKGIARAFCYSAQSEVTFWFGKEGDVVLSYNSYIHNKPGYESIELLEDSSVYQLKMTDLQTLFNEDLFIANWGRKLAEFELVKTEERLISRQFKTAAERYKELIEQCPELIQRVQLGYIASYLGVTQVTLSRIRAELK
ncbi:Crp/Fnr family transcriptional regulator [Solitalea longa]|uniref:Crp/Fnr family transcriptional regulator n=1 Tax=Solitalea longa TaxID=2079460 RepID=A0A2S5A941_9SPHI|nr:Crp/Fnr family transcriptional regulator [Solitalea longa]POY39098.1 Crp/Fnr family transcriptional regulator [Solitalea longa]